MTAAVTKGRSVAEAIAAMGIGCSDLAPLIRECKRAGFSEPLPEFAFHAVRQWRFDLAWPELKVAFEREGGKWGSRKCKKCGAKSNVFVSRHHSVDGLTEDADKYNAAAAMGWLVVRATPPMLVDGRAHLSLIATLKSRIEAC